MASPEVTVERRGRSKGRRSFLEVLFWTLSVIFLIRGMWWIVINEYCERFFECLSWINDTWYGIALQVLCWASLGYQLYM